MKSWVRVLALGTVVGIIVLALLGIAFVLDMVQSKDAIEAFKKVMGVIGIVDGAMLLIISVSSIVDQPRTPRKK